MGALTAVDTILYGIYGGYPRLIRSKNGGQSWDKIDSDSLAVSPGVNELLTGAGSQLYHLAIHDCSFGTQVQRSDDNGSHWSQANRKGIEFNCIFFRFNLLAEIPI